MLSYSIQEIVRHYIITYFFFFNDTATTEIYTLSLHDALPISTGSSYLPGEPAGHKSSAHEQRTCTQRQQRCATRGREDTRSEEHTSELQSRQYLVCRLLLEKKKK